MWFLDDEFGMDFVEMDAAEMTPKDLAKCEQTKQQMTSELKRINKCIKSINMQLPVWQCQTPMMTLTPGSP